MRTGLEDKEEHGQNAVLVNEYKEKEKS